MLCLLQRTQCFFSNAYDTLVVSRHKLQNVNKTVNPNASSGDKSVCSLSKKLRFLWARQSGQHKEQIAAGDCPTEIKNAWYATPAKTVQTCRPHEGKSICCWSFC